jgi:hypothetical protein
MIEQLDDRRCHARCDRCMVGRDLHAATVAVAADVLRATGWTIAARGGPTICVRCASLR